MKPLSVRFSGFGGQGIVLSAVILGTAAVTKRGFYALQTQSYGSEARGGQCQSELIVSDKAIMSPSTEYKDVLVAMYQTALDAYLPTLKQEGTLIIDPAMVNNVRGTKVRILEVPATETAIALGNRLCSNMVVLGYFAGSTGFLTRDHLVETMVELVPEKFHELNAKAIDAGFEMGEKVPLVLEA